MRMLVRQDEAVARERPLRFQGRVLWFDPWAGKANVWSSCHPGRDDYAATAFVPPDTVA